MLNPEVYSVLFSNTIYGENPQNQNGTGSNRLEKQLNKRNLCMFYKGAEAQNITTHRFKKRKL